MSQCEDAFAFLIAPVTTADFFEHIFEREVLLVSRNDATYASGLYGVACVEDALVLGAAQPDHFALVKDDVFSATEPTSERRAVRPRAARRSPRSLIDPRSVLAAFADGYTLNIKDASAFHPPLARLCNRIQSQLGLYVHTNVYFTPPGAAGFGLHYDTHDTLIVQIDGGKDWEIHAPVVPLPLEVQPFSHAAHTGRLGEPRNVRLETGDSLYIPHGFPHRAYASNERSLHLTFALAPLRAIDLLEALVGLAALENVDLRRALAPGWRQDPEFAARFAAQVASALPRALTSERIALAADLAQNELFGATRTAAGGTFDALAACDRMTPASRIVLRAETPYERRTRDDRLHLILASKVVSLPRSAEPALARLEKGPATLADIVSILEQAQERDGVEPAQVRDCVEPAQERACVEPAQERACVEPAQERDCDEPAQERACVEPAQERNGVEPAQGRDCDEPAQGRDCVEPTQGRDCVGPTPARDRVAPTPARDRVAPAQARDFVRTLVIEGLADVSDPAVPPSRVRFDSARTADGRRPRPRFPSVTTTM